MADGDYTGTAKPPASYSSRSGLGMPQWAHDLSIDEGYWWARKMFGLPHPSSGFSPFDSDVFRDAWSRGEDHISHWSLAAPNIMQRPKLLRDIGRGY